MMATDERITLKGTISKITYKASGTPGKPLFVAADICKILEIQNPSQDIGRVDDDWKDICSIYTLGGKEVLA